MKKSYLRAAFPLTTIITLQVVFISIELPVALNLFLKSEITISL